MHRGEEQAEGTDRLCLSLDGPFAGFTTEWEGSVIQHVVAPSVLTVSLLAMLLVITPPPPQVCNSAVMIRKGAFLQIGSPEPPTGMLSLGMGA